eukprot:gnl/TRDRNA2_/TRDRNA2_32740_c0_seq1.p1 gnl/TRDRNA2_/TRDRNA2_32740_c0~~gnl/TRDRNA2_/TRDRNA2_32740_c0_seq1.p1  ORF type:complete len:339 (+),score=12.29 gnl/TRDRNA2_/TRDRNA2_32740_c0_seq1:38-1054(+)
MQMVDSDSEDSLPTCRFCLSSEDDAFGGLISPCKCSGTSKYIHRGCLRRWRTAQATWEGLYICPVCRTAYTSEISQGPLRLLSCYPVAITTTLSTGCLWALAPRLHRLLAGATWVHLMAPLQCFDYLNMWELRNELVPVAGRWLLNSAICLTGPALIDHAMSATRTGSWCSRLCELVLLWNNFLRVDFLKIVVDSRSLLSSSDALQDFKSVLDVIAEAIKDGRESGISTRRTLLHLRLDYDAHPHVCALTSLIGTRCRFGEFGGLPRLGLVCWCYTGDIRPGYRFALAFCENLIANVMSRRVAATRTQILDMLINVENLMLSVLRGCRTIRRWALSIA